MCDIRQSGFESWPRVHDQAMQWIARHATEAKVSVLDLGGRDVNGSPKALFPNASEYTVVDILPGEGVDVVADAATYDTNGVHYDVVVCAETFEHTAVWPGICRAAYKALKPGGKFIVTTAGPGRPPHSAIDGLFRLHPGEHYANVPAAELARVLHETGFNDVIVDSQWSPNPCDTRAVATR
jgi:SAM-dependent methyltransferase